MKSVLRMLGVALAVAGCIEPVPPPTDTTPAACKDSSKVVGSLPATSASFDIDCTFDTGKADTAPGVGELRDCKTLSLGLTFADGTVQTYPLTGNRTYVDSTYQPGGQASTQLSIQLSAQDFPFADGWVPAFFITVPVSLAQTGSFPVGARELSGKCWEQSTCVGLAVGAIKDGSNSYSLGETDSGQVTIDAIGLDNGSQVKLRATGVKLEARLADETQATCADGKIHHRP